TRRETTMSRKQYSLLLALAMLSGLVGGAVSSRFFIGEPVFAQRPAPEPVTFPQYIASKPAEVVRAHKFELVDRDGKTRASLELGPEFTEETLHSMLDPVLPKDDRKTADDSSPRLVMSDKDGKDLTRLGLHGLYLYDKKNSSLPIAQLQILPDGTPYLGLQGEDFRAEFTKSVAGITGLAIYDKEGIARAGLGLSPDGRPGLALLGQDGMVRAGFGLFPKERPGLFLYDMQGIGRAVFGLTDNADPVLSLFDNQFKQRAMFSLAPNNGEPAMTLYDKDANPLALLGSTDLERTNKESIERRSASSLILFGKDGNIIWSTP
ncbi:MAG: hypothetical protein ACREIQ_00890, partial [Nitrospiria bacterium]